MSFPITRFIFFAVHLVFSTLLTISYTKRDTFVLGRGHDAFKSQLKKSFGIEISCSENVSYSSNFPSLWFDTEFRYYPCKSQVHLIRGPLVLNLLDTLHFSVGVAPRDLGHQIFSKPLHLIICVFLCIV